MYKTSFHFFSKLKNVSREQLLSFIETAVNLHPHLRELLSSDAAAAAAGPPAPPVPPPDADTPWCHCGRCRQMPRPEEQLCCRRRAGECILQTAHNELNDVVLRRNVLLVAVRHMNDLFAYNEQPGNDNFRHAAYRQFVLWRFGTCTHRQMACTPASRWRASHRVNNLNMCYSSCYFCHYQAIIIITWYR